MNNIEIWKDVKGFEGLYQISNFGNVKSVDRISKHSKGDLTLKGRILKPINIGKGYLGVALSKNGKVKNHYIHRLVAEAFINNNENKPCIDHINGNRTDNRVNNLRWVNATENMNNPITTNRISQKNSIQIVQFTIDGEFVKIWNNAVDAEQTLGIDRTGIRRCCRKVVKTAGGYMWKNIDDVLFITDEVA